MAHSWVCAHNNEYRFNLLLVLQLFALWIGLWSGRVGSGRIGSNKRHKLTGRVTAFVGGVGPGNFEPRATLVQRQFTQNSKLKKLILDSL